MFAVENENTEVELKVDDWNRFSKKKPLGSVKLPLVGIARDMLQDIWLPLSEKGEVRVLYQLSDIKTSPTQTAPDLTARLPHFRLQLENTHCYPGSRLRGAVIYGRRKTKKIRSIKLVVEGISRTHWSTKQKKHYYGTAIFLSTTAALVGPLVKSETTTLEPGVYIFPFECLLPSDIPHTYDSGAYVSCYNRYSVIGYVDVASKPNKICTHNFKVLCHPSAVKVDHTIPLIIKPRESDIKIALNGDPIAFVGKEFKFGFSIQNLGRSPIAAIKVVLKSSAWFSAREDNGTGKLKRRGGAFSVRLTEWNVASADTNASSPENSESLLKLPLEAGSSFNGSLSVNIPQGLCPSLHCATSPLIQNAYRLSIKCFGSGTHAQPLKSAGATRKMLLTISDSQLVPGASLPENITTTPRSSSSIVTAPAPPAIYPALVPTLSADNRSILCAHRNFGSVSLYPGAVTPLQSDEKYAFGNDWLTKHQLKDEEWKKGQIPSWFKLENDDEPSESDEGSIEFTEPLAEHIQENPKSPRKAD